jgi:HAMP domain-containing protein
MLSNLSIGKRLAVVLGSILALSLATDLFATLWLQRLGDQMTPLLREDAQRQTLAGLLASCQWQLLAGSALSMLVGGVLATQLARSITRPLQQSQTLAAALANLDLRGQSHAPYSNDEAGQLLRALDTLRHSLQHSLHDLISDLAQ